MRPPARGRRGGRHGAPRGLQGGARGARGSGGPCRRARRVAEGVDHADAGGRGERRGRGAIPRDGGGAWRRWGPSGRNTLWSAPGHRGRSEGSGMSGKFPFAIISDGTTVLPQPMRRELDMRTLPLHVSFGAESYTADVDLTAEQFYEKIKDPKAKPTTSQPSIGECRDVYEAAQRDGYNDMLVLPLPPEFSGNIG